MHAPLQLLHHTHISDQVLDGHRDGDVTLSYCAYSDQVLDGDGDGDGDGG